MVLTEANIKKNIKNCCLQNDESINAFLIAKSKLSKNIILALTSKSRLVMGSIRVFGKSKSVNQLSPSDINLFDFKNSSKASELYKIKLDYNGKSDEIRVIKHPLNQAEQVKKIAAAIYKVNPAAMPGDLKGANFLGLITGNKHMIKFTTENIIIDEIGRNENTKKINYSDITDYDYYVHKIGDKVEFYLEVNNNPSTYKVSSGDLNLVALYKIFSQTNSKIKLPKYMVGETVILMDTLIKFKSIKLLSNLKNNILRVTDKTLYILQVKDKHPQLVDKISINDIKTFRKYEEMFEDANGHLKTNYGIEITQNSGDKITFFSEASTPSEIEEIIKIIEK